MRFRKSVKIAPGIKINFSKKGMSTTFGSRGFSVNTSRRGTFVNTGIPGTGLYSRKKISGNSYTQPSLRSYSSQGKIFANADLWVKKKTRYAFFLVLLFAGFIFLFIQSIIGLLLLLTGIVFIIRWILSPAGKSAALIRGARSHYSNRYIDAAIIQLEKANSLYPNPYLPAYIISLARENKHPDIALKYLNETGDNDPTFVFARAECNFETGHFKEAARDYEKLTSTVETEAEKDHLYLNLGTCYFNESEFKNAIQSFQQVSVNFPGNGSVILLTGQSFLNMGDTNSAIFTFTDYIGRKRNLDPDMMEMCYQLGHIYLKQGDKAKAKNWLNKVYSHNINYKDSGQLLQGLAANTKS